MKNLEDYVRNINDFPKEGIIFRDVTSVIQDKVAPESRGFIFGMPIAYNLNKGFVPVRKKGKLPCETISQDYDLEYGSATLQMHLDSIKPNDKVVIIDDLLATGGTIEAIIKMVERLGGQVVRICTLIELVDLKARDRLKNYSIVSCVKYKGE